MEIFRKKCFKYRILYIFSHKNIEDRKERMFSFSVDKHFRKYIFRFSLELFHLFINNARGASNKTVRFPSLNLFLHPEF